MIPGLKSIPGFNGAGSSGGGAGGGKTFTFVGSATSGGDSITIPTAAIAGDWGILFDAAVDLDTAIPATVPAGWSSLATGALTGPPNYRMVVSERTLVGGGSITGLAGFLTIRKILLVFRSSSAILTKTGSTWGTEVTASNPASQLVSASGVAAPLGVFAFAMLQSSSAPTFSTESPSMTNITRTGTNISIRVGYTMYDASPSNQSVDLNDAGTQGLLSGYVRFT